MKCCNKKISGKKSTDFFDAFLSYLETDIYCHACFMCEGQISKILFFLRINTCILFLKIQSKSNNS